MGVGDFQVIAEYIVEPDLQGIDPRSFRLFLLQLDQVFLAAAGNLPGRAANR